MTTDQFAIYPLHHSGRSSENPQSRAGTYLIIIYQCSIAVKKASRLHTLLFAICQIHCFKCLTILN